MFIHWIALEKLHGRSRIRAISKLGRTLRQSWEKCRVTKKAIFQQCRTLFHHERLDQYPRPHQIWNQRRKLSTTSVQGSFSSEFHFSTEVEPYSPRRDRPKMKIHKTWIQVSLSLSFFLIHVFPALTDYVTPLYQDFMSVWFFLDPCGGVRLDFRQKMKLAGGTPNNRGSTQFSALIPNLIRSRVLV